MSTEHDDPECQQCGHLLEVCGMAYHCFRCDAIREREEIEREEIAQRLFEMDLYTR